MTTRYSAYQKRWMLDQSRGVDRSYTAAGPVRDHIAGLLAVGVKLSTLAHLSGCSKSTIRSISAGRTQGCQRSVARRVLAVTLAHVLNGELDPNCHVPAFGAQRRIRALHAIGHTYARMNAIAGFDLSQIMDKRGGSITVATHRGVVRAYSALSMTRGPSQHNRTWAARQGWAPPLAWDDDALDDPTAKATGVAPTVARLRAAIHLDDIEELALAGAPWTVLAARTGASRNSLERHLDRAGRLDLMRRIARNSEGEYALAERRGGRSA